MNEAEKARFHRLYGEKRERIFFKKTDFLDYEIMTAITALVVFFVYGLDSPIAILGLALCVWMAISYPVRHGVEWQLPIILKRPQDIILTVVYKVQALRPEYYVAVALLVGQHFLIQATPEWPHYPEEFRTVALYLFYIHFGLLSVYRTVILVDHLRKKERVEEVLNQSVWKSAIARTGNVSYEIWHAYFTGLLTHIVLIAPWFLVINLVDFSAILAPVMIVLNILIFMRALQGYNAWYYRDHWLGHNSEFEFVYLHGSHHDAIPSGLIGVSGNGFLEGFFRHTIGGPIQFFNPVLTFLLYSSDIKTDIDTHQYIPGIFPMLKKEYHKVHQHSMHHYGKMRPLGFGINLDQQDVDEGVQKQFKHFPESLKKSAHLDTELNGFEWDNSRFKWFIELIDKYEKIDAKK